MKKIIYNGKYCNEGTPLVTAGSRGLRYGDGCFETMKMVNGKIALKELHFERLFSSLDNLGFDLPKTFDPAAIEKEALSLAKKNGHDKHARIRLNVFRGEGGLYDPVNHLPNFIIETWPLEKTVGRLNENGLTCDIFIGAKKTADQYSSIKSNNGLPYLMAAKWAAGNKLNDALLLNSFNRLADSTIANVFIVSAGVIKTPALSEGCIAGVMRQYLLNSCRKDGIPIEETQVTTDAMLNANEVFLTNAIRGIMWVKQTGDAGYRLQVAKLLYEKFVKPLW